MAALSGAMQGFGFGGNMFGGGRPFTEVGTGTSNVISVAHAATFMFLYTDEQGSAITDVARGTI